LYNQQLSLPQPFPPSARAPAHTPIIGGRVHQGWPHYHCWATAPAERKQGGVKQPRRSLLSPHVPDVGSNHADGSRQQVQITITSADCASRKQHRGARAALLSFIHPAHKEERAMGCQQQQQARLTTFVASATLTKNSLSSVFSFEAPMNTPSLRNFVAQGTYHRMRK
jgi:hypothetical protein